FEERHSGFSIAIVLAGTFQYRGSAGRTRTSTELMTPGSLLLGSAGQSFECGHEHARGDRCLSFHYSADYLEKLAADAGLRSSKLHFPVLRLPPIRELSSLISRACAGLAGSIESPANKPRTLVRGSGPSKPAGESTSTAAPLRVCVGARFSASPSQRTQNGGCASACGDRGSDLQVRHTGFTFIPALAAEEMSY